MKMPCQAVVSQFSKRFNRTSRLCYIPAWQRPLLRCCERKAGAGSRIRTDDLLITNQLL